MEIFEITAHNASILSTEYGMRAYENSERGRGLMQSENNAEIVAQVFEVWGPAPTVVERIMPLPEFLEQPTIDERLAAAEGMLLYMLGVSKIGASM